MLFEELLFEGKNKHYGAYVLRTSRHKYLTLAFGFTSILFVLLLSAPSIYHRLSQSDNEQTLKSKEKRVLDHAKLSAPPPIELDKPPEPPKQLPKEPPKLATVKYVKPVVAKDEEVLEEEEIPTIDDIKVKQIGTENVEGDSINAASFADYESYDEVVVAEESNEPFISVSQMPTFEGGEAGIFKFLGEHLRYPSIARENKIQGLVIVQFVIERDGTVARVKVLRGIGFGCDEEAIRVVQSMPKWTPGRQGDKAVPVQYNLPIRFVLKNN